MGVTSMRKIKKILIFTIATCFVATYLIGQNKLDMTGFEDELPEIHSNLEYSWNNLVVETEQSGESVNI